MKKLAAAVVDQSTDLSGRHTYRIVRRYDPPEYVKTAAAQELNEDGLEAELFADPWRHRFLCHTKAATWLSAAFFYDQIDTYPAKDAAAVEDRLVKFARFHDIADAVSSLKSKAAALNSNTEDGLDDNDFALVLDQGDGQKQRYYPLRNGSEVKAAAEYINKYRDTLRFEDKNMMAVRVLEKADKYGANLGEYRDVVTKCAGDGACSAADAASLILHHVEASRRGPGVLTPVQAELLKLANLYIQKPSQLRDERARLETAKILDTFDRGHGLHFRYGKSAAEKGIERPEDVLFAVTGEKMAALVRDNVETPTGNLYKMADLERLRGVDIAEWFGSGYAEAMTGGDGIFLDMEKSASVIKNMPHADAEAFDALMAEKGLQPWAKTATHREISWARLKELAEMRC
jgi:hypothetical protein